MTLIGQSRRQCQPMSASCPAFGERGLGWARGMGGLASYLRARQVSSTVAADDAARGSAGGPCVVLSGLGVTLEAPAFPSDSPSPASVDRDIATAREG